MHVDVVDILRLHSGILEGVLHNEFCAETLGMSGCDVISVCAHAASGHLCIDMCAASFCVFKLFEHEGCRAFADYEAIAASAEGTRSLGRLVVEGGKCLH